MGKENSGRYHKFTPELCERICREVSTSTLTLKQICANNPDFPTQQCIHEWRIDHPSFGDMYDKAKRAQADLLAQEVVDIADDKSQDYYFDKDGNKRVDPGAVAHRKLQLDARKWVACKLLPKVYGDKQETNLNLISHDDELKKLK